jgi:hypothetical protein
MFLKKESILIMTKVQHEQKTLQKNPTHREVIRYTESGIPLMLLQETN